MRKEYIAEEAYNKILNFLRSTKQVYVSCEHKCKKFIEAIYWMARTEGQWRELPKEYGDWNSVFKRFNSWSKKQIWQALFTFCSQDYDGECEMIDATIVRANACAAGYGDQETEGLGRSPGGFTSKIHARVDGLRNPLQFIITSGQTSDITQAEELVKDVQGAYVIADKGYDSQKLRDKLAQQQCIPVIPSRSNSLSLVEYDQHIYKKRSFIECFFSKIKYSRRIFSRFDKSARNFLSFLTFVGTNIWLR